MVTTKIEVVIVADLPLILRLCLQMLTDQVNTFNENSSISKLYRQVLLLGHILLISGACLMFITVFLQ